MAWFLPSTFGSMGVGGRYPPLRLNPGRGYENTNDDFRKVGVAHVGGGEGLPLLEEKSRWQT